MDRRNFLCAVSAFAIAGPVFAQTGSFTMRRVIFESKGETLAGALYLPAGVSAIQPVPALVVTGAWFTVKEQMPTRYAQEMVRRGFAALVFDFRGFGESGGAIRQRETPAAKIDDIEAAADFLRSQPEVNEDRVGGLGICASAGYMVAAATRSASLRSLALVAPWLHDAEIVEATYGGSSGVRRLIEAARAADEAFRATGRQTFVPGASRTNRNAIMFDIPYYCEPDRGLIPAWRNEIDPAFWEAWLTFDAISYAPRLRQPLAMVHSEDAAIPQGAHRFYARVTGKKSQLWLKNITQFDFYDRGEPVTASAEAVARHFAGTL
jgi:dienelactone hydrolase